MFEDDQLALCLCGTNGRQVVTTGVPGQAKSPLPELVEWQFDGGVLAVGYGYFPRLAQDGEVVRGRELERHGVLNPGSVVAHDVVCTIPKRVANKDIQKTFPL